MLHSICTLLMMGIATKFSVCGAAGVSSGVRVSNVTYEEFLVKQLEREKIAKSHLIIYGQLSYEGNQPAPGMVGCGRFSQRGEFEQWVKWELPVKSLGGVPRDTMPIGLIEKVSAVARPNIYQADGGRVLSLTPDKKSVVLWT